MQLLFGIHYVAAKEVLAHVEPRHWAVVRAGVAGLAVLAAVLLTGRRLPRTPRDWAQLSGLALIGVSINQLLFVEGLARTSPGHSAVINCSIPVLVLCLGALLGRERIDLRRAAGVGITIAGVLALIGVERLDWSAAALRGDLLTLTNATSYSFFLVLGKPVLERFSAVTSTAILLTLGALWLLPYGGPGLAADMLDPAMPVRIHLLAALIVVGPTIGAYGLNTYALRRVPSSVVALFVYSQPVIATALSVAFGYERLTARQAISSAVVLLGVTATLRAPRPAAPSPVPAEPTVPSA